MKDLQFYPTPKNLASKMAYMIPISANYILEPSAGTGSIVTEIIKRFENRYSAHNKNIYACEIDPRRQMVLNDLNIAVLGNDFLEFEPKGYSFDCIIMNPPFNKGLDHLNHAYSMLAEEGTLICLLNSQSMNDGDKKKVAIKNKLENDGATFEIMRGAFSNGEVKTDVECVLIKVKKPATESRFDFFTSKLEEELSGEESDIQKRTFGDAENGLMKFSFISNMVARYNKSREKYSNLLNAHREVQFFLPVSFSKTRNKQVFPHLESYNTFIDELRRECWNKVFDKTKIARFLTGKMREEFDKLQNGSSMKEFTVKNINSMLLILIQNKEMIMRKSVEELFDTFTKHHKENRLSVEGWKTNSHFKVNQKLIEPWAIESNWMEGYQLTYSFCEKLNDIEKTLCLMTGKSFEQTSKKWAELEGIETENYYTSSIERSAKGNENGRVKDTGKWYDSEFFKFKFFKKGTMHLEFKEEKVWEQFNIIACREKAWLG